MGEQWRVLVLLLAIGLSGCVPIPYRPSASVGHTAVTAEDAAAITLSTNHNRALIKSVSRSIRKAEPRVELVDGTQYLGRLPAGHGTLADVLAGHDASPAAPDADYLLCVGSKVHRQLHDTGAAAPFPDFPIFWVGYEKIQSRESLAASLVDLRAPAAVESLQVSSTYSEVIASFAYGVATIAMPESALRQALARDVARTLTTAHPTGTIRLIVLAQDGGTTEGHPSDSNRPAPQAAAEARRAAP
jgi:hypothetical protein